MTSKQPSGFTIVLKTFLASLWGMGLLIHLTLVSKTFYVLFFTPDNLIYSTETAKKADATLKRIEQIEWGQKQGEENNEYKQIKQILEEMCKNCGVYINNLSSLDYGKEKLNIIASQINSHRILFWFILGKIAQAITFALLTLLTILLWKAKNIGVLIWLESFLFCLAPVFMLTAIGKAVSSINNYFYSVTIPSDNFSEEMFFCGVIGCFILIPAAVVLRKKRTEALPTVSEI